MINNKKKNVGVEQRSASLGSMITVIGSYPKGQWFESILLHFFFILLLKIFKKNSI